MEKIPCRRSSRQASRSWPAGAGGASSRIAAFVVRRRDVEVERDQLAAALRGRDLVGFVLLDQQQGAGAELDLGVADAGRAVAGDDE
jgi:hypothetical protein